jgi:hypothetical protein
MSYFSDAFAAMSRDAMRRKFEARKLTQDGAIWPVRRAEMRHGQTIRERMVEDLYARIPDSGRHTLGTAFSTLCTLGWAAEQVTAEGERAVTDFRKAHPGKFIRAKP